jgi:hypothetical protein
MPSDQRLQAVEEASDPGISLWGSSDSESFNAAREDVIVRLIDRVEQLEARLDAQLPVRALPSSEASPSWPCREITGRSCGVRLMITRARKKLTSKL